jgi:predicted Zn-dependent protease
MVTLLSLAAAIIAIMRYLLVTLALGCAVLTSALGQSLPDLGDISGSILSPQMESRIGEEAYREIRFRDPKFLDDPEITTYVSGVGRRLLASSESRQPFEFFMIQDSTINAFAMPGGFVGVHTGLLLAAQSESEVASVLAHEISHVTQHHIARMVSKESQLSTLGLAAMVIALIAARSNPDIAQAAIVSATAGSIQAQLDYSRDFEREADRVGFQLLHDAGFDVHAMPAFFERLQKSGRLYDNSAPAYLRTHPLTTERMADMQNRAAPVPYKQTPDSLEFQLVRAKLRAEQGAPRDAVFEAEAQLKEHRYASEAGARYALVAALVRARNYARAERELAVLRALYPQQPIIELLAARLKTARGDVAGARDILRAAIESHADYRPLGYALVEALQALGQHTEALARLEELVRNYPRDVTLYSMRAQSFAATGQRLLQHQTLAEQYYLMGTIPAAIEQLQLAEKSGQGDFYQLSALEARMRQLRAELAERTKKREN